MSSTASAEATRAPERLRGGEGEPSYLTVERGLRSWLTTTDHKRIGIMFLVAVTVFLMVGGVFALLMRIQLLSPEGTFAELSEYNRFFTLHGVIMVWLFMIPSIPTVFGNFVVPLMLGAHDVAFPKLNLASFWIFVAGSLFVIGNMVVGGLDTGWTFYTPYSASSPYVVVPTFIGIFVVGWSSILTGINLIATVHTCRSDSISLGKIPLFVWAIYGTSVIQMLATPVLGMVLLLLVGESVFDFGLFDPARGGDPLLYQHLFWFYSHPAVYIMILPAMGVVIEVICTFSQKNPLSYGAILISTVGIALVGFLSWGHHMFVAGMSRFDAGVFGILTMFVSIFSAIKVFTWTGTLYRGAISFKTPLFYVLAFLFFFVFGGMTGVALATVGLDVHWTDTYFVIAHFHFIMVGGTITGFLAALHYWFPKMFGRMYPERLGLLSAALVFMGFFVTFFPQFLLGNAGMPRRYATYPPQFQTLHVVSTVGAGVLGTGLAITLAYLIWALFKGEPAGPDPWFSESYEWRAASPPIQHNFEETPFFPKGPYAYDEREDAPTLDGAEA
ncbi:MAG TPA: cbb3-type cytochrome c oxidase subunit I [Planctomycetota bacterium]|nr:cbb3-type cytochrome c oxidase subunit I [Planctomycetota bacterium]